MKKESIPNIYKKDLLIPNSEYIPISQEELSDVQINIEPFMITKMVWESDKKQRVEKYTFNRTEKYVYRIENVTREEAHHFHSHNYYEMMIIIAGSAVIQVESEKYSYKTGDILLINKNIRHMEQSLSCVMIFIQIKTEFLEKWPNYIEPLYQRRTPLSEFFEKNISKEKGFSKNYINFINVCESENLNLVRFFDEMMEKINEKNPGNKLYVYSMLVKLFQRICNHNYYQETQIMLGADKEAVLADKIRHYIDQKKMRVSRTELAEKFHYNGDYINRVFKKYYGMTTKSYAQKTYISEAVNQLLYSDLTVTQIALNIGFENRSQFYRVFQNYFGVSPLKFRDAVIARSES